MPYYRTSIPYNNLMRLLICRLLTILLPLCLGACSIIYKLPTRQGNIIEQKQLDQLKVGMTREQVKFLMGTALAASPFRNDRVDYYGYYKSPRGDLSTREVSLYFEEDKLTRMEGVQVASKDASGAKTLDMPDVTAITSQQKKDRLDDSRAVSEQGKESGVNIPTPAP